MKKIKLLLSCVLIITLACVFMAGCSKNEKISSIEFKDHDPSLAIEMPIGVFDYNAYILLVTYDSGRTEELALSADMISEADVFKFYREGEHEVTASYGGKTYGFKISVKRGVMNEIKFPDNNVFVYDGSAHTVEVEGDIPANAVITYLGGNSFVNAGTYNVTAIISCEGYVTQRAATTVKIERAKYDMSGVKFEPKEVVYNGSKHSIAISGTLPDGVSSPTYYINGNRTSGETDAGEYTVKAVFSNNNPNYETIPDMEAVLKINPAEYSMPEIDFVFENEDGSDIEGAQKTYDKLSVLFDIKQKDTLSNKIKVAFSVIDESGNVISTSNKITNIKNTGVYTVRAEFYLSDSKNYKAIEPVSKTFEVKKASYDLSGIYFDSDVVEYDGEAHRLAVTLPSEFEVTPEDVTYEYYLNDQLVQDAAGGVCEVGKYTVRAIFTVKNKNYEQIPDMRATLIIEE